MINSFFMNVLQQKKLQCLFYCKAGGVELYPSSCTGVQNGSVLHVTLKYQEGLEEQIFLTALSDSSCKVLRRFRNTSGKVLHLNELVCKFSGITFNESPQDDYFYHVENPRMYSKYCLGVDEDHFKLCRDSGYDPVAGNRWSDPGTIHERVGRSPYQPFPAILLSNKKSKRGIVHGTLSQKVFYHCYTTGHDEFQQNTLNIFSAFKTIDYREVKPGETLVDEWYAGVTEEADDIQKIFSGYAAVLRQLLQANRASSDTNRHTLVWGSWNDGNFRKIQQEQLLKTAKYIKENFPTVEWIQIDDGYALYSGKLNRAHGLGMAYEGNDGVDPAKFPDGMESFFNKIREIGLRPAIWIGGFCPKETPIYKEHPEWFFNYDHRVTYTAPLDISKPEVQEYTERAFDLLLTDYGCEGIKHDFWSYAFEEGNAYLSGHEKSGYEYRSWYLNNIRRRLSADSYMQACCDICMNNPFLGEYFNNYRYGIDIGHGAWETVKITFLWGGACFATHTGDLFIPNSDSVGVFPGLNDDEALFCLNYALVTASMVEIAGFLDTYDGNPRLDCLRKAVCCPNNGQEVFLAGIDYRNSDNAPEKYFFKGPFFSLLRERKNLPLRTLGFFNLEDENRPISATVDELELPAGKYLAYNVWNGSSAVFDSSFTVDIPAHGSALYSIVPLDGDIQLLDCELKVTDVKRCTGGLQITFAFAGKAVIAYFDGKEIKKVEFQSKFAGDTLVLS